MHQLNFLLITDVTGNAVLTEPDLSVTLRYMDNGEWLMEYNNIAYEIFAVKFDIAGSKVKSVTTRQNKFVEYGPYTFIKN